MFKNKKFNIFSIGIIILRLINNLLENIFFLENFRKR